MSAINPVYDMITNECLVERVDNIWENHHMKLCSVVNYESSYDHIW